MMNLLKHIGQGARALIKLYRNHVGKENGNKELRQTNIRGYYGKRKGKLEVMGKVLRGEAGGKNKSADKKNKIMGEGKVPEISYTVFVIDNVIYWEFKKG